MGGGVGDRRDPPRHRFAAPPRNRGGVPQGWGGVSATKFCLGGRVGLGGRRPDPGLLAPNASAGSRGEYVCSFSHFLSTCPSLNLSILRMGVRFVFYVSLSLSPAAALLCAGCWETP